MSQRPAGPPGPFVRQADEGDALWVIGGLYEFRARGDETLGAYTLVEVTGPAGFAIPRHLHDGEEEAFYVARGAVTFAVGEGLVEAQEGAFAFVPRGVEHAFRLDSADARLLLLLTPGGAGHEGMFAEMGEPAVQRRVPDPPTSLPPVEELAAVAARHGTRLVGPPIT